MPIVRRQPKQRMVIGENVELVGVVESSDRVKPGVNAPSKVPIRSEEVRLRIQSENEGELAATAALAETETVVADLRQRGDRYHE